MSTWFQQYRVAWIAETILIFGFINREHIQKKFGVSTPQASLDINLAIQTYPGLLTYNTSAKRYEIAADINAAPSWSPPSVARIRSAMDGDQEAVPATGQPPEGTASPLEKQVREWLIRKDGYYYRPNRQGYTTRKVEAGRYTKAEADRECAVEPWHMIAIHQDEIPDEPQIAERDARIAELVAENKRLKFALNQEIKRATEQFRRAESLSRTGAVKEIETVKYVCGQWEKNQGTSSLTIAVRALLAALEPVAPEVQQEAMVFGLSADNIETLRTNGLKPEEIAGGPREQALRVRELLHWFVRLSHDSANPKWTRRHAFELAYYIATTDDRGPIDINAIESEAWKCGLQEPDNVRDMAIRHGWIPAPEITRPASGALPQDVIDLVIAARIVAFDDQSPEALRCLDVAVGAFAERVPWDDDPEALKAASEAGR